jgi:hypothetical protein
MGLPLSSADEENSDSLPGQAAHFYLRRMIQGKPGDDPGNEANTTLDLYAKSTQSWTPSYFQIRTPPNAMLFDSQTGVLSHVLIMLRAHLHHLLAAPL